MHDGVEIITCRQHALKSRNADLGEARVHEYC